jgi:oxygen-independent coproporphyrinogen III oxidase
MSGIYIHIPFCTHKCYYCDFYSGNQLYIIDNYVDAIVKEIEVRSGYLGDDFVETIYFGGGTPSLLSGVQIDAILKSIAKNFHVDSLAEITFECNPENITSDYIEDLYNLGINRISLGVQFLDDKILEKFNRRHNKSLIFNALDIINKSKIANLSVDLIYSVPGISDESLASSLDELMVYDIKHISAYSLTISKNSILYWKIQSGEFIEEGEENFLSQYKVIGNLLKSNGFIQYEISNYARDGYISRHNLAYWNQIPYLGVGVSAHSYNRSSRQWNMNNIKKYIRDLNSDGVINFEYENLSEIQLYNEYIITKLRTLQGLSQDYISQNFNDDLLSHFNNKMAFLMKDGHFVKKSGLIIPNENDLLVGDYLAKILMYL